MLTKDAVLDESKLLSPNRNITVYDDNGEEIANASLSSKMKYVAIEDLQPHTINAFIASEDRSFYRHNGLNYKRMLKAAYKNVVSHSFKEGASTISQQLIKNTHLTGDKNIMRKLNEIRLTGELEKKYTKNEILEMYLNTIYFGHNCYGLESAAEFYFDKKAENLTLEESATLAGLLSSPNNYSPFKHPEKSVLRRNLVLKAMSECNYINESEYKNATKTPLNAVKSSENGKFFDYLNCVLDELEEIDLNFYNLTEDCKIYTYLNQNLQNKIESLDYNCDNAIIVTSTSGGVNAYKSTIGNVKRQPGSTIKPLAVYAPAIEEKLVYPFTKIHDEKINYDGYSPENSDGKYHGYVSVADSLKYSYNVPAVKTLNSLSVERAEKYLNVMGCELEETDKNLSLALGGMTHGLTLKQIADGYSLFANSGTFTPSRFIKKIQSKDGKILYERSLKKQKVFSEGTCSLINEMLIETTKGGTAKKLREFNYDIATKTGTCGNEKGNTDAYAVSYTSENCVSVWLGDKNNDKLQISGGKDCCEISKIIFKELYSNHSPSKLEVDKGTETINIDAEDYYNENKIVLADKISPKLNLLAVKTISGNIPKEVSTKFSSPSIVTPQISVKNNQVNIGLCQTKYYSYLINRVKNGKNEQIYDGKWTDTITDCPSAGVYSYTVTPYFLNGKERRYGKEIILPQVNIANENKLPQIKIPDIAKKDWYNQ